MLVIPAIDLQSGRAVRLLRGEFEQETVYDTDPVAVARRWQEAGAELIHVVDLDGARQGRPVQLDLVGRIAAVAQVEAAGGLRTQENVQAAIDAGATRIVVGTSALDFDLMQCLIGHHGERIVVALDTREGKIAIRGWIESSKWSLLDLARQLIDSGVQRFLHTDIERDGTLTSPNYSSLEQLIALGIPVIASGGVASLDDISSLRDIGAESVIVGRALYEGTIDLQEAIAHAG
jgi:phosphoribosylformimino-5-aminoimidazole carboxamide ribotide isomerase